MTRRLSRLFAHQLVPLEQPTEHELAVCAGKNRYHKKQVAKDAAARSSRRGVKVVVYQCPTCSHYHLTSVPQDIVRAQRRRA